MELELSSAARSTAGGLLVAIVAIEWGGAHMLRIVRGRVPVTEFQQAFARAGHAHAGVLVTLALVCQLFADAAGLDGLPAIAARNGVPLAALLMPAGFFLSSMGREAVRPNKFILLLYAGTAVPGDRGTCSWPRASDGVTKLRMPGTNASRGRVAGGACANRSTLDRPARPPARSPRLGPPAASPQASQWA